MGTKCIVYGNKNEANKHEVFLWWTSYQKHLYTLNILSDSLSDDEDEIRRMIGNGNFVYESPAEDELVNDDELEFDTDDDISLSNIVTSDAPTYKNIPISSLDFRNCSKETEN